MQMQSLLEDFLKENDAIEPAKLGGKSKKEREVDPVRVAALVTELKAKVQSSNRLANLIVGIYLLLIIICLFLGIKFQDEPDTLKYIFGGSFLSLLPVIKSLQGLWKTKSAADMLVVLLPDMTPKEAVKAIQSIYFNKKG